MISPVKTPHLRENKSQAEKLLNKDIIKSFFGYSRQESVLQAAIWFSSFPWVPCVRVRVRVPEPQESVHDPQSDQSDHPSVVVSGVVVGGAVVAGAVVISTVVVFSAPVVVSAPVTASKNNF